MSRDPNTSLRRLLENCGWSGAQLAHAIRTVAAEQSACFGCDRSTVARWLAGTQPRPPAGTFLLEALSRRLDRPVTAEEAGLTRAPAQMTPPSWESDPVRTLARLTSAEADPERRHLLAGAVFSLAALTLPDTLHARPPVPARPATPTARHPGQPEVDELDAMADVFAAAAALHGGEHTRPALAAYLHHVALPQLHAPTAIHDQLLSATARLTLLLGLMCADSGHDATAQYYHHTAAQLAAEADDHTSLALALRIMASHAHDLGHHHPAVLHLAHAATEHARHAPPAIRAFTHAQLAVLQAHHHRHDALNTLTRAEQLHTCSDAPPGPFTTYPLAALHYQRAQTLATLGDSLAAARALNASLAARSPTERHATALTHAAYAELLHRIDRLDQALAHWSTFTTLYPTLNSARAKRRLHTMRQQLTPHRHHPDTRAFLAQTAHLL
ncbi:hypothetical protein [Streptomyces sp. NPDC017988]|uniref:hypothetical protein n=1 Tax=Streptomyces sp. NPDC017988 TaxID=3365025 RepID=UPI00379C12CE